MAFDGLMVSVAGGRGRVGDALTPEGGATFAAAFGAWASRAGNRRVVVGRDSRVSGPMFTRIVHGALESVGCTVIDIGMVPTPTIQLAVEHHHAAGGLGITASHNPIEWNALKFIGPSGLFLSAAEGAEMRSLLDSGIPRATWDKLGEIVRDDDAVHRHIAQVLALPWLDVEGIRARRFRVALDCCHGAGSVIMPALLTELGCEVYAINMEADGRFHRPPEPVAENLGELEALVRSTKADIGFATDPDVDRLALVLDDGKAPGEDYTLAFAARTVLRHRPGPVVTNLSTSKVVSDVAHELGVPFHFASVGEVNVAIAMRDAGAPSAVKATAGSSSPSCISDAMLRWVRRSCCNSCSRRGRPLSELVADRARYVIVKDRTRSPRCIARRGVCRIACGVRRCFGGHTGRAAARLVRSVGASASLGDRADRARHRRSPHRRRGASTHFAGPRAARRARFPLT